MNWHSYFYSDFPGRLQNYVRTAEKRSCTHHREPHERATLVKLDSAQPVEFWCCWYMLALTDNVIRFLRPQAYEIWLRSTGGCPIPMQEVGFGCIERMNPNRMIIETQPELDLWAEFIGFMLRETEANIQRAANLSLNEFLSASITWAEINNPENKYEGILMSQMRKRLAQTLSSGS